jgi:uncharacterized cupredoxin-like copper-binding protein
LISWVGGGIPFCQRLRGQSVELDPAAPADLARLLPHAINYYLRRWWSRFIRRRRREPLERNPNFFPKPIAPPFWKTGPPLLGGDDATFQRRGPVNGLLGRDVREYITTCFERNNMKPLRGLILIAAAVILAGCSSGNSNPATTTVPSTSAGTTASAPGTAMTVTESEFTITLPSKNLSAGTYTFKVTNNGKFAHNLTVDGAGVQDKATPTLAPGSTGDLTVTLQKGSYEFYCSVDNHKDTGMDLTVRVT